MSMAPTLISRPYLMTKPPTVKIAEPLSAVKELILKCNLILVHGNDLVASKSRRGCGYVV